MRMSPTRNGPTRNGRTRNGMARIRVLVLALTFALITTMGCATKVVTIQGGPQATPPFAVSELPITVGGQPVLLLSQPLADRSKPQVLEIYILPGRGMNIYKIRGFIPGKGVVDVLSSDSLQDAERRMNGGPEDFNGNQSFSGGGPILIPFANRIRGQFIPNSKDPKDIHAGSLEAHLPIESPQSEHNEEPDAETGEVVHLPANWQGKAGG